MKDMHIHLERGPYTKEWLLEFVRYAKKRNIKHINLLEHSHRFTQFVSIYESIWRDDGKGYRQYQKDWLKRRMAFDFDYVTGSIHWVNGWGFDHPKTKAYWDEKDIDTIYEQYYELMIKLAKSGLFHILAHPDSIKCFDQYSSKDLTAVYTRLAKAIKEQQLQAEFSSGLYMNYGHEELGLNKKLLHVLQEHQVDIVTASDAHCPEDVGRYVEEAEKILKGTNVLI